MRKKRVPQNRFKKFNSIRLITGGLFSLLSAWALAEHLNIQPAAGVGLVLLTAMLFSLLRLQKHHVNRTEGIVFLFFAAVISLVLVLGEHLNIDYPYYGTIEHNYITPYSTRDIAAFLMMIPGLWMIFSALYTCAANQRFVLDQPDSQPHRKRQGIILIGLLAGWIPYLLCWWPGIMLEDTTYSVWQALDFEVPVNNHPVLYTLLIKGCFQLGEILFHSRTAGYAIYTIVQMVYVGLLLSWIINWVWRHAHLRTVWGVCIAAIFALTPYFGMFSIAGWKDPIFSISVAALSVWMLENSLHQFHKPSKGSLCFYILLLLVIVFFRHNGVIVLACVLVYQAIVCLLHRKQPCRSERLLTIVTCAALAVYLIVLFPVYDYFGVEKNRKSESSGLFIQQMARVAAVGGDMTEADQEYLSRLYRWNKYDQDYRPTSVDQFKWSALFNHDVVEEGFVRPWFSMLVRNPVVYAEAWELNSFGFWTLNVPLINQDTTMIEFGVVRNATEESVQSIEERFGVRMKNLWGNERFRQIFSTRVWFIPIGWIFWGLVFLLICLLLKRQPAMASMLIPSFALLLPLVFFTPIYYWSRYAVATQYLLPVYALLFVAKSSKGE